MKIDDIIKELHEARDNTDRYRSKLGEIRSIVDLNAKTQSLGLIAAVNYWVEAGISAEGYCRTLNSLRDVVSSPETAGMPLIDAVKYWVNRGKSTIPVNTFNLLSTNFRMPSPPIDPAIFARIKSVTPLAVTKAVHLAKRTVLTPEVFTLPDGFLPGSYFALHTLGHDINIIDGVDLVSVTSELPIHVDGSDVPVKSVSLSSPLAVGFRVERNDAGWHFQTLYKTAQLVTLVAIAAGRTSTFTTDMSCAVLSPGYLVGEQVTLRFEKAGAHIVVDNNASAFTFKSGCSEYALEYEGPIEVQLAKIATDRWAVVREISLPG